jgi:enoyl-CoA hydratase/carnithine racemase
VTDTPAFTRTTRSAVGSTAVLTLASDKVNALDIEVFGELASFVGICEQDPGITALVVTGEGPVFSAGLNVSEVLARDAGYTADLLDVLQDTLLRIFTSPIPTVVAVNGPAIAGGCLLACAFDRRLIADSARIGVTELKVGVAFPTVAVELLRHVCGHRAEPLMFDAGLLPAEEAVRVGLAHQSLPAAELLDAAVAAADGLASLDPAAYALAKASSRRAVLDAIGHGAGRSIDAEVRAHWQAEGTRANLAQLLKPKG